MALKSRPAKKGSAKAKAGPTKTPAKNKKVAGKAKPKVAAKSAAKTKSVAPKATPPAKGASKPAPKSNAPVTAPPTAKASTSQLAKAKKALERTSTAVVATPAPPKAEGAPAPTPAPKPAKAAKSRSRKISIDISANEAAGVLVSKWNALFKRAENIDAKPYNMKQQFDERTAIVHKVLGWGYILANRNDRLEVLFKDGIKYLISNYKP